MKINLIYFYWLLNFKCTLVIDKKIAHSINLYSKSYIKSYKLFLNGTCRYQA